MNWKRFLLYAIALNCILFFRGCDQSGDYQLTAGAFVPYQVLQLDDDGVHRGAEVLNFSLPLLALNLALATALLFGIKKYCRKLDAFLGGRGFLVVAIVTFVVFNLALIPNHVWAYAVFWPTGYLYEAAVSLLYWGNPAQVPDIYIDVSARLYFVMVLALLSLIVLLFIWIKKKTEPPLPSPGH